MTTTQVASGRTEAIAGKGVRHDAELRQAILAKSPDFNQIVKTMCQLEGGGLLMADTVALFRGRCSNTELVMQIDSMISVRPRVLRRAR